jgi:glycosyltransferase involved in cell wall biosynthesis
MKVTDAPTILFLTKYSRKGASSRYRTLQYVPYFEDAGFHCNVSTLFEDDYLEHRYQYGKASVGIVLRSYLRRLRTLLRARDYDMLVIEYELFPYLPALATRILRWFGVRYTLDYDDAIFHQYDNHRSFIIRYLLSKKISNVMRGSEVVIVGNNYLADYASAAGAKRVEVVPTVLALKSYPVPCQRSRADAVFKIGWIGSPSTAKYLEAIAPALAEVCSGGQARVVLIGSGPCSLCGVPIDIIEWSEETEVAELNQIDVGIMPLPDELWARGKCGFKLIQYMACGLPVVASPVGINREIVEHEHNGYLTTDHASWVDALTELRDNKAIGEKMGRRGRAIVESNYNLEISATKLLGVLNATVSLIRD